MKNFFTILLALMAFTLIVGVFCSMGKANNNDLDVTLPGVSDTPGSTDQPSDSKLYNYLEGTLVQSSDDDYWEYEWIKITEEQRSKTSYIDFWDECPHCGEELGYRPEHLNVDTQCPECYGDIIVNFGIYER